MNKKAILASLFVAVSSTAAFADPYIVQGEATVQANVALPTVTVAPAVAPAIAPAPAVIVRDHRDNDDQQAQAPRVIDGEFMRDHRKQEAWTVLSSADRLMYGRSVVRLGRSWKKYDELELAATKGSFDISRVKITFTNGRSTVLQTASDLRTGGAPLLINLDGSRSISSVTVYGQGSRRAQFEILGA